LIAWRIGIPTSESHALISGISGAAIASGMSLSAINPHNGSL
jgi:PiT family inorganic phosphate transporter